MPVTSSAEGLPIGVQVVARPWEELTALAVARVIEQARGAWQHRRTLARGIAAGTRHRTVGTRHPALGTGMKRSPSLPLIVGLVVSLVTIAGMGWYTVREVRTLRDEQTAISERNRRDSLQLIRIQSNLATVATALRDMADRVEPYPVIYWRQTFDRLRADLDEAIALENTFSPAERPAAQQQRLRESVDRLWSSLDQVFAQAAGGDEDGALARVRTSVGAQHQELVGLVSQFLVLNNRVQEEASQRNREVYERVVREIVVLVAALLVMVALIGAYTIWANRQAFQEVARLSDQLRTLSWRMLRIQEDLQQSFSRELHDDFGQVFTAIGTLLGRIKRNLPADSSLVGRCRRGPGHRAADAGADPRAVAPAAPDGARRLRPREGRRVVRRAVRPPARHRHALRGRRPHRGRADRNPTSTSIASCRRR